jgi:hypothetical protein
MSENGAQYRPDKGNMIANIGNTEPNGEDNKNYCQCRTIIMMLRLPAIRILWHINFLSAAALWFFAHL